MPCWIAMEKTKVISASRRNTGRCQLNTQFYQKKKKSIPLFSSDTKDDRTAKQTYKTITDHNS